MARARTSLVVAAVAAGTVAAAAADFSSDPNSLLAAIGILDVDARKEIRNGGPVVEVLPAEGRDLAVAGVTPTVADGRRLAGWSVAVDRLYRGPYSAAIGRFSDPPQLSDVASLTLDEEDVNDLRECSPGDCAVKLGAGEIETIRAAAQAAGTAWKTAVQLAFRQVVLERARAYLDGGLRPVPPYRDHGTAISPAAEFDVIADQFDLEPLCGADVVAYFRTFPDGRHGGVQSFLYWSKDTLGAGKPIVSITHVAIFRRHPPALAGTIVAARQVFANHYLTGSLSITLITDGRSAPGYLVYLRRSRTDAFKGLLGGFVRRMVEGRIRSDAPGVLDALRRRLEEGDPPVPGTR